MKLSTLKFRSIALVLAAAFSANASARDAVLDALVIETGLSLRDVKMVVGARSGHAEYLASYDQTQRRFVRAIGKARYRELMAGREVRLFHPDQRVAAVTLRMPTR